MKEAKQAEQIRKLIDLDKETVKRLQIQAIERDYGSVKEYIEAILEMKANEAR